jgi:protein-disulfide isomerase
MDFSALPPAAQRELATVLSDEFCYCGCPHTLGQCLRSHSCQHARRMTRLAARHVAAGAPATEVIVALSRYYASFREPRVKLEVDARLCMGPQDAQVTLVEFSDFECPYCGKARPVLEAFAKKHAKQVRLCYAPFPLPSHPNALPAAQAALWARDKGRFWEMHDALFEHQEDLSPTALVALAGKLGLPGAELQKALKEGTYAQEVERFRELGRSASVRGTPALFVEGRLHGLGFTEEDLAHTLEDELEWRANRNAWAAD